MLCKVFHDFQTLLERFWPFCDWKVFLWILLNVTQKTDSRCSDVPPSVIQTFCYFSFIKRPSLIYPHPPHTHTWNRSGTLSFGEGTPTR